MILGILEYSEKMKDFNEIARNIIWDMIINCYDGDAEEVFTNRFYEEIKNDIKSSDSIKKIIKAVYSAGREWEYTQG